MCGAANPCEALIFDGGRDDKFHDTIKKGSRALVKRRNALFSRLAKTFSLAFVGACRRKMRAAEWRGCDERRFQISGTIKKLKGRAMQMITRRVNEGLVIDNEIHVTVLDICKDCVRLSFYSPRRTPSYWEETVRCTQMAEEESREELLAPS
jgi:carbon storage regulator CsrA